MALLIRVNPRVVRGGFASGLIPRSTGAAYDDVLFDTFFGIPAEIATAQGGQTTAATATVTAASTFISTGQGGQTSDIVAVVALLATIETGQGGQTTNATADVPLQAAFATGQGGQTTDAVFSIVAFQRIQPVGWLDAAIVTTQPGKSFWGANPRVLRASLATQIAGGGALAELAEHAEFVAVPYEKYADGFGAHSLTNVARQDIIAYGLEMTEFGEHTISLRTRVLDLFGRGISTLEIGTHEIYNSQTVIQVPGFDASWLENPSIRTDRQYVYCEYPVDTLDMTPAEDEEDRMTVHSSIGPTQTVVPAPFSLADDQVPPVPYAPGTPAIGHWLQYAVLTKTVEMTQWGTAWVVDGVRYVYPSWFVTMQFGRATIGWTPTIKPNGIPPGALGKPDVSLGNLLLPQGLDSSQFGGHEVKGLRLLVYVGKWKEIDSYSEHLVYNLTQFVDVLNTTESWPTLMGVATKVRLRDFYVQSDGISPPRIANTHTLHLTGQAVQPVGTEHTQWGDAMVAYRVRHLYPSWLYAGYIDPYHFVHNASARLHPVGWDSLDTSTYRFHRVWFNAQRVNVYHTKVDDYGTPFVADGVRWVQQYSSPYTFKPGYAWVSLGMRFVIQEETPPHTKFGTAQLVTRRNRVRTSTIFGSEYGTPYVRNVTPQLFPYGVGDAFVERPWVSHSPRTLVPDSITTVEYGKAVITFRDRKLFPHGFPGTVIPWPDVRTFVETINGTQYIRPKGIPSGEIGGPLTTGHPKVFGWDSAEFGATEIRLQGCHPRWDYPDSLYGFGTPFIVFTQTITEINDYEGAGDGSQLKMSPQRVDPHTIWARLDTPKQARDNHPLTGPYHVVDTHSDVSQQLPTWFGHVTVGMARPLVIYHNHNRDAHGDPDTSIDAEFGEDTRVELRKRYVAPVGFLSLRIGFHTLNPRTLTPHVLSFVSPEFDDSFHKVGIKPLSTQYVKPTGWLSSEIPKQTIEKLNREIYLTSFSDLVFGNNYPMVYHYPRGPNPVSMGEQTQWGEDTWISHYIRYFQFEGWDSFTTGYTVGQFEERMRVTKKPAPATFGAGDQLRMGVPLVEELQRTQRIGPYMIPPPEYCHPHHVELEEA